MGLVAPHFWLFEIDGLAAASSHPICLPRAIIAPAVASRQTGRVLAAIPDIGRNGGARGVSLRIRAPGEPSHARQIERLGEPPLMTH